jgi:flagellar biosynthesis protein FlhA
MARNITAKFVNDGKVDVITLEPRFEELIANSLIQTEQGVQLVMDPRMAQELLGRIAKTIEDHPEIAAQPVLLTSPTARRHIFKLTSRFIPQLVVLSHSEIAANARIASVGVVEMAHAS